MNFINGWSSKIKQNDKINLTLRLGKLTILEIKYDISDNKFTFMLLNLGVSQDSKKEAKKKSAK